MSLKLETKSIFLGVCLCLKCVEHSPHNIDRSPVRWFESFVSKRPPDVRFAESLFYLAVNYNHTVDGFWTQKSENGHSRIGVMMKRMASFFLEWKKRLIIRLEKQ